MGKLKILGDVVEGGLSLMRGASKADEAAKELTAAERAAAGRKAAELIKSQPQVKASEALGQLKEKGFKRTTTTQADRTRVGGGNIGGAPFPAISEADPAYKGKVWGVMDEGTAARLKNLTTPETAWTTMLGSANQLKTNPIVFDKLKRGFIDSMKQGNLSDELAGKINHNLELTFGAGADIRDPKIWRQADTFEKRAALADVMMGQGTAPSKGGVAIGGEKSGKGVIFKPTEILKRETEPYLLHTEHGGDVPTFAAGPRLFRLDKESVYDPSLHPGFPTLITGEDLKVNMIPTPTEVYLRDWHTKFKKDNPERKAPGYYDLALGVKGEGLPSQELTDEYIRHLIREGFKKGGAVEDFDSKVDKLIEKHHFDSHIDSKIEQHFAKGGMPKLERTTLRMGKGGLLGKGAKALAEAMKASEAQKDLRVYHGSPHRMAPVPENPLGKFDSSKMGTGEGGATYGVGHYLAQAKPVAKTYQPRSPLHEEKLLKEYKKAEAKQDYAKMEVLEDAMMHSSPSEIVAKFSNVEDGYTPEHVKAASEFAKWSEKNKPEVGGLYHVDLPKEHIANMIDYDKPINQQSNQVKALLEKAGINSESSANAGEMIYGQERHLAKHGIPGVKYYDEGSRHLTGWEVGKSGNNTWMLKNHQLSPNQWKEFPTEEEARAAYSAIPDTGTRNFVVFPGFEDIAKIVEREKNGGVILKHKTLRNRSATQSQPNGFKDGGKPEATVQATPRKKGYGTASDVLKGVHEFVSKPFGYDNPPAEMLSDFIGIPAASRVLDKLSYGEPITNYGKANVPFMQDDTFDAFGLGLGALGSASKLAKPLAKAAKKLPKDLPVGLSIKAVDGIPTGAPKLKVKPPSDNVANVRDANFKYPKTIGNQTLKIDEVSGGVRSTDPHERKRVKELAEQMSSPDGYISRIIVDHNNNVIEGQHRLEALRQLGVEDVPVYKIEDLADTLPVSKMEEAMRASGGIHPDHVNQLMKHALDDISQDGIEGARQMDYGKFQKYYDAALNAASPEVAKAKGGFILKHHTLRNRRVNQRVR